MIRAMFKGQVALATENNNFMNIDHHLQEVHRQKTHDQGIKKDKNTSDALSARLILMPVRLPRNQVSLTDFRRKSTLIIPQHRIHVLIILGG